MTQAFTADSIAEYFGYASNWVSTRAGERIHYLDEGPRDGRAVVLVHGSAIGITAAANFYLTIPALVTAGYRVIAPDLHGYGWTEDAPDTPATRENQVDQIWRLLDAVGIQQAYLIGNSLGGMVAATATLDNPERVLGLIVIGTAGALWKHGSRFAPNPSSNGQRVAYSRELVKRSMEHLVSNPAIVPARLLEYRIQMAERPGAYERHIATTLQREESKKRVPFDEAKAGSCPVPALFMYGKEDRVNPPEDALAGAEAFAHADMMLFGHCGHWTMIERADDFNALMLRFLDGYDRRIVAAPNRAGALRWEGGSAAKDAAGSQP